MSKYGEELDLLLRLREARAWPTWIVTLDGEVVDLSSPDYDIDERIVQLNDLIKEEEMPEQNEEEETQLFTISVDVEELADKALEFLQSVTDSFSFLLGVDDEDFDNDDDYWENESEDAPKDEDPVTTQAEPPYPNWQAEQFRREGLDAALKLNNAYVFETFLAQADAIAKYLATGELPKEEEA